jgi:hypothetical protein
MITTGDFIIKLAQLKKDDTFDIDELFLEGRKRGWIEEQDITEKDRPLDRRTSARLIHMYMKNVLKIDDIPDITPSYHIRDLFDCRICANHIAQVLQRIIMDPVQLGDIQIFDVFGKVTDEEAEEAIRRLGTI